MDKLLRKTKLEKAKRDSNKFTNRRNLIVAFMILDIVVIGIIVFAISVFNAPQITDMNQLASDIRQGKVEQVVVYDGTDVSITYVDGTTATAQKDPSTHFYEQMDSLDVPSRALQNLSYSEQPANNPNLIIFQFLIPLLPIALTILIIVGVFRMNRTEKAKR